MSTIPRQVEATPQSNVLAMTTMILTLPLPVTAAKKAAVAVMPGQSQQERVTDAVRDWKSGRWDAERLLVSGQTEDERRVCDLTGDYFFNQHGVEPGSLRCQVQAAHTQEQANWLASQAVEFSIQTIFLYSAPFHMVRCYLTLLKSLLKTEVGHVRIWPVPALIHPDMANHISGLNSWEMMPGELERIICYQENGSIATLAELRDYFRRHWAEMSAYAVPT